MATERDPASTESTISQDSTSSGQSQQENGTASTSDDSNEKDAPKTCVSVEEVELSTEENAGDANKVEPLSEEEIMIIDATIANLRKAQACRRISDVEKILNVETILMICKRVEAFFLAEPCLLNLKAPINAVGDIHGQFLDLLRYFEVGGWPPDSQYLFLGDYIDRGKMGMECTILLFCYKLRYPDKFFMLRGNHECSQISRMYGFHDECRAKYDIPCWKAVNDVFRTLPLAAIVNDRIFATHGGLSPDLHSLEDFDKIVRPTDVPVEGIVCDLLWADPSPEVKTWEMSDRGVSYLFGDEVLKTFMETYDFDLFVRAHQVVENGYEFYPPDSRRLVTIFSAVNYCGQFDNSGAMLIVDSDLVCSFHVIKPQLVTVQQTAIESDSDGDDSFDSFARPHTPRPD
mmetsp:Transcript_4170/g.6116  ORF Transcript_4170/g.6116 Transcript_4170/m.6116 type:complete len:403 (-) Transcript_4170:184-1392(-)